MQHFVQRYCVIFIFIAQGISFTITFQGLNRFMNTGMALGLGVVLQGCALGGLLMFTSLRGVKTKAFLARLSVILPLYLLGLTTSVGSMFLKLHTNTYETTHYLTMYEENIDKAYEHAGHISRSVDEITKPYRLDVEKKRLIMEEEEKSGQISGLGSGAGPFYARKKKAYLEAEADLSRIETSANKAETAIGSIHAALVEMRATLRELSRQEKAQPIIDATFEQVSRLKQAFTRPELAPFTADIGNVGLRTPETSASDFDWVLAFKSISDTTREGQHINAGMSMAVALIIEMASLILAIVRAVIGNNSNWFIQNQIQRIKDRDRIFNEHGGCTLAEKHMARLRYDTDKIQRTVLDMERKSFLAPFIKGYNAWAALILSRHLNGRDVNDAIAYDPEDDSFYLADYAQNPSLVLSMKTFHACCPVGCNGETRLVLTPTGERIYHAIMLQKSPITWFRFLRGKLFPDPLHDVREVIDPLATVSKGATPPGSRVAQAEPGPPPDAGTDEDAAGRNES